MNSAGKFSKGKKHGRRKAVTVRTYKKDCVFCKDGKDPDYKDYESIRMYVSDRGRIMGRIYTGLCNKHQKKLSIAIKRGRFLGLLPYIPS